MCAKDQIEDWFDRLAECLHWNVRKPQKMLDSSRNTSDSSIANNDVFHEEQSSWPISVVYACPNRPIKIENKVITEDTTNQKWVKILFESWLSDTLNLW